MTKEESTINSPKTTITNDLISRKDLLNKIFQQAEGRDYDGQNMLNLPYIDLIESMPTITAEPRTAEWVVSDIPDSMLCKCSNCCYQLGTYSFKFCPNCGSRMTEPKEGE